jgi:hypothetical protein
VLVVASGNIVHNLRLFKYQDPPLDWALRFDEDVAEHIATGHHDGLLGYETLGSDALLAIPSPEHTCRCSTCWRMQREAIRSSSSTTRCGARCRCARSDRARVGAGGFLRGLPPPWPPACAAPRRSRAAPRAHVLGESSADSGRLQ